MDLTPWRPLLTLAHVLAAFAFLATHGVSMAVWWRLRRERDRTRLVSFLDLSASMLVPMTVAAIVLIASGILAGIAGGWWFNGQWWLWLSIGLLVIVVGAMTPLLAIPLNEVRQAAGIPTPADRKAGVAPEPADDATIDRLLRSPKPTLGATIGIGGLVLITALMTLRPF